MELRGWISSTSLNHGIPVYLRDKLLLATTCDLTAKESKIFYDAIEFIARRLISEQIYPESLTRVTCIFTNKNQLEIDFKDFIGIYSPIIVYRVNEWRRHKIDGIGLLTVFLEELCHCYYRIEDEVEVRKKVDEIIDIYTERVVYDK